MKAPCRFATMLLGLAFVSPAHAHNGPPFPMISDRRMGPYIISLWTHPDVGTGTFFVVANAAPGMSLPEDLKFEIGVSPVSGRLKEKLYPTTPRKENGETLYYAFVPFDRQERWRVNLYLRSSAWNGEASGEVEVTPTGFAQWDLVFFSLPFVGIGVLWIMGMRRRKQLPSPAREA